MDFITIFQPTIWVRVFSEPFPGIVAMQIQVMGNHQSPQENNPVAALSEMMDPGVGDSMEW